VLAADEDYTSVESKKIMVAKIKGAKLQVIEDCRHAMPVERPDEFNQALMAFLEGQN
jgi:pimeloyl-ACP methyl ester carboxylesterase